PAGLKTLSGGGDGRRADVVARTAVPKTLGMVLEQALEAEPDERFQTTTALANALRSATDVADPGEVSHYLEELQRVALDTRRRALAQALGRAAPTSMPPPAAKARSVVPKIAGPPRIPSFAITPPPAKAKP